MGNEWKHEWLKKVCELCDEYRELDGLQDAKRSVEIPEEIIYIVYDVIKKGGYYEPRNR